MSMKIKRLIAIVFLSTFGMLYLAACDTDGPAENLREEIDEAANDTKREVEDATD